MLLAEAYAMREETGEHKRGVEQIRDAIISEALQKWTMKFMFFQVP